jgi:hypothetical protein
MKQHELGGWASVKWRCEKISKVDLKQCRLIQPRCDAICLLASPRVRKAATSKVDPWQQRDWILKCLQGGRVHPLAVLWGGNALQLTRLNETESPCRGILEHTR